MTELDVVATGALIVRIVNAVLWSIVCVRVLIDDKPVPRLVRQLITTVIVIGMWVLVLGGFIPFGFPGEIARFVYTVFTAYAGIIALAVVTEHREGT